MEKRLREGSVPNSSSDTAECRWSQSDRHVFEPFRQFSVYGNPCSANLFVRGSDGLRLVRINDEGSVKLGIESFSQPQPQQRQHRVVNGCQVSPQVEQPVSARRYFLQNLLGREGSKKLVRPIDLRFPYFQPESCIRAFVSHGSFSSQRLPSFPEGTPHPFVAI